MLLRSWLGQGWQLGLTSSLALVWAIGGGASHSAFGQSQIIPDATLGAEPSVVFPNVPFRGLPTEQIEGGTIRGKNLFHSFEQFNVDTGRGAYFKNPNGIENILSRVTGGSPSQILGRVGVRGNANLFLINPNGIIFGPNAALDVTGSFAATTANAIRFGNQGFFSASAPQVPQLLTINPSAFLFNQVATGAIANQSVVGLRVPKNRSLLLVGGDVNLDGGILQAPEGRIELGGVAGAGTVRLDVDGNNLRLSFPNGVARADVSLTNGARVDVSGNGSGNIQLSGRRVRLSDGSQITAITQGSEAGGTLSVNASESVEVIGTSANGQPSRLSTQVNPPANQDATGAGGNLTVSTGRLIVEDGAEVSTGTFSQGQGGTLTVIASDSVELSGTSTIADGAQASGGLFTQTEGTGAAGDLMISTGRLIVRGGAQVSASTGGEGRGGTLTVTASDSVELSGTSTSADNPKPSGLFALTQEDGSGAAGNLTITTGRLIVRDGAQVSASNRGEGRGGTLRVTASDLVELSGTSTSADNPKPSGLFALTERGSGAAGNLTISTRRLIAQDGAQVSASTRSEGRGGTLRVTASDSVELSGASAKGGFRSGLFVATAGTEDAGNLTITTLALTVRDGSGVTVRSEGLGKAGNIEIDARSIVLDNQAFLTATTQSTNGGNITLRVQDLLLLRNHSNISTTAGRAQAGGNGGNIAIAGSIDRPSDRPFIVAVPGENSNITAKAYEGNGGNIQITAQGIFGIQFREDETPLSDITASSDFGVDGVVQINTPDVDPSRGLVALPAEVVDASGLIASGCGAGSRQGQSEFIITGRGGIPSSPSDTLSSDAVWTDLRPTLRATARVGEGESERNSPHHSVTSAPRKLVEAQGWVVNNKGEVVLTAQAPTSTLHSSWQTPAECHSP